MQSVEQDTAFLMQVGMHVCVCVCVCVCVNVWVILCVCCMFVRALGPYPVSLDAAQKQGVEQYTAFLMQVRCVLV